MGTHMRACKPPICATSRKVRFNLYEMVKERLSSRMIENFALALFQGLSPLAGLMDYKEQAEIFKFLADFAPDHIEAVFKGCIL